MLKQYFFYLVLLILLKSGLTQKCDFDGAQCISCTQYRTCSEDGVEGALYTCEAENNCNDSLLMQCQLLLNCFVNYALDECTAVGVFPDSSSEEKFYVCLDDSNSGLIKLEFSCSKKEFFDQATLQCVPKALTESEFIESSTSSTPTEFPEDTKTSFSSSTTFPSKSTMSTEVTSSISTVMDISTNPSEPLPSSEDSSETSFTTMASTPFPSTLFTTTPISTVTTDITTVSELSSSTTPSFTCTVAGIFPNPSNCKGYFRCSTSLKKFSYICPGVSYFNENILKCSLIVTPLCQEQISNNSTSQSTKTTKAMSTSTSAPTTTASKSTSTTKSKIDSTPSSVTKVSAAPIPTIKVKTPTTTPKSFSCTAGGIFPNPNDCKTYFRCSAAGKMFVFNCPGNSYFNEVTKTCGLVMTPLCQKMQEIK